MSKINTLIVDADPIWRDSIKSLLAKEQDIHVISSEATVQEALQYISEVDIVVLDINLEEYQLDGIEIVRDITTIKPVPIIIVTTILDQHIILTAFQAGAMHYIDKLNYNVLPATIREVTHTRSPFQLLLEDYHKLRRGMTLHSLTPAENEIIDLIIKGYTLSNISMTLFKAKSTVKNQLSGIYKKMNVQNRNQLINKFK
ncbi:MAG TPA: response regulator transcription factor [Candidatus Paenibacillus intestinavium]|nr:response regulator transcription factor [Candidatus Paenibacillus intestinavium]